MPKGPIIFEAQGDSFSGNGIIAGVIWKYSGAVAGDEVSLQETGGDIVWEGLAQTTQVYQGGFGMNVIFKNGLTCNILAGGKLFIYLREEF